MDGKWAMVTGGALRIGRAICSALSAAGCNVIVHYNRSAAEASSLVTALQRDGVESFAVQGDLVTERECHRVMCEAWGGSGGINFLVNNASVFNEERLLDCDEETLMRQLRPNFIGPFLLTMELARRTATGDSECPASVVNLLDTRIFANDPGCVPYLLSKKMLAEFTRVASLELAPVVRINGVAPGAILPPVKLSDDKTARHDAGYKRTPKDVADAVVALLQSPTLTGEIVTVA